MPRRINPAATTCSPEPLTNTKRWHWFLVGFVSETIIARELLKVCAATCWCPVFRKCSGITSPTRLGTVAIFAQVFHYVWLNLPGTRRTLRRPLS